MKADKERIIQYLMELIDRKDPDYAKKTVKTFSVSLSTVYNYVAALVKDGRLIRDSENPTGYVLPMTQRTFVFSTQDNLSEDRIFRSAIEPFLTALPRNVYDIWAYGFTEMMNNAIEHSQAQTIRCQVEQNSLKTKIAITDDGIGIFRNIRRYLLEITGEDVPERECPGYLLAGRFTTAKSGHSGEGLFFTSHLMDGFEVYSYGVVFSRSAFSDSQYEIPPETIKGTSVIMTLANQSVKKSIDVFNRFSDAENGFNKTEIPMSNLFPNGYPVSRSEARRLFAMIGKFQEVTLDFEGIESVGQAFVHELFVVLPSGNPTQKINLINASPAVSFMISRVKNTV